MARRSTKPGLAWTAGLAAQVEALGAELGRIIAAQVRKQVESEIDVSALAQGLLEGRRGRRGLPERAVCKVAGCGRPLLAKGFCRSHYYRERYRTQKAPDVRGKGKAGAR